MLNSINLESDFMQQANFDDVWVFGSGTSRPALEILSAGFDSTLYCTDEAANLKVAIKSNWASGSHTVAPVITPQLLAPIPLSPAVVTLSPGSTALVPFVWSVPSVGGQTSVNVQVAAGSTATTFYGVTWITPVPRSVRDAALEEATQCAATCGFCTCTQKLLAMIPVVGILPAYTSMPLLECMAQRYEDTPGRERQAAAMKFVQGLSAWAWGSKAFSESVRLAGQSVTAVVKNVLIVPGAVSAGIVCASALTDWFHWLDSPGMVSASSFSAGLPEGFVDTLLVALDQARDSADVACADVMFVTGSCSVRIEADSSYATADSSGLAYVRVFDMPDFSTRGAWIGSNAFRFGRQESDNPRSTATARINADSTDTWDIVLLHRGPDGGLLTLRYAQIPVDSGAVARISVSQDAMAPPVQVDNNGDGLTDWLYYPGGAVTGVRDEPREYSVEHPIGVVVSPNPARGPTWFSLDAAARVSDVRIEIYDVAGRLVRNLPLGNLSAGVHQVLWDRKCDAGRPVRTGVYFYRVATERQLLSLGKILVVQ